MRCGLVERDFARLWCPTCRISVLCPFSCRGGNFCPSCEKKKQLAGAARDRGLDRYLGDLCSGIHTATYWSQTELSRIAARFTRSPWDAEAVMTRFRERLRARLLERHAISEDLARRLVSWRHPGFSAHVGNAIPFEDKKAIEDLACYLGRAPSSLKKLVYLDGQKAVLYRSKMNPFLGRNFEAMDPREWRARLAEHIPDAGKHRTHFYAYYANRVRGQRSPEDGAGSTDETEAPKKAYGFMG